MSLHMNTNSHNNNHNNNQNVNILARQNVYIRPRLIPINEKIYIDSSTDDTITTSDKSSCSTFSSSDSLGSFEDYRINIDLEKNKYNNNSGIHECNRGIMTSICCSWCACARS